MNRFARLAAFLVLTPAVLAAQEPVRRQVDSLHAAMVAAFSASPASTAKFYTDDAAILGGGVRVIGRAAVDGYWNGIGASSTWKLETLDVGGPANAPWVHGRSTLQTRDQTSITDFIGLLQRGPDGQLRFRVDAYTSTGGTTTAADEAAVRSVDSLWARMYQTHDTVAALQLYAEPLVFISANGRQKTRAEELADVRPAAGLTMEYFRTAPDVVKTYGRLAIVSGVASWRFSMNGAPRDIRRTYTAIYSRGGPLGWRVVAIQMGNAP